MNGGPGRDAAPGVLRALLALLWALAPALLWALAPALLWVLAPALPCFAADVIVVTVVAPTADHEPPQRPNEQLRAAIEAHISSYPVVVTLTRDGTTGLETTGLETTGLETTGLEATARASLDAGAVQAAAWLSDDGATLALLAPALGDRTRTRDAPDSGEGWAARCEMLAAMVLSELEPVLSGHAETETETERRLGQGGSETTDGPNTTTPEETGTGPNTTTPNETGTGAETVPVERGTTVSWWLGVSYLPVILSADGPYLHGLGTHLALRFGPVLQLDLGADLVQPAAFETPDGHGELARWPLRAGLSAWWAFDTIEYGLGLGAVVEIWNVRRLDYEPADAGAMATRTNAGLTAVVRTRIKPLPWLAPLLDLGLDAYPTRVAVGVDSTELLHRPRIMLRLAIGVTAGGPKR